MPGLLARVLHDSGMRLMEFHAVRWSAAILSTKSGCAMEKAVPPGSRPDCMRCATGLPLICLEHADVAAAMIYTHVSAE